MLSDIGKEMRKLRVERGERLLDMGKRLGKSASFISAVEVGSKSPPQGFEDEIIAEYALGVLDAKRLRSVADKARRSFTIQPMTDYGRDTAAMFARRINELSDDELEKINAILDGEK
jgi:transcriptional regulator with XRE-family HTH domain